MSSLLRKNVLVTGATGKQGKALIQSLTSQHTNHPFNIYALTRDAKSKTSQSLARLPNVKVVTGDFSNPNAIFAQVPEPWGLFAVTIPLKGADLEEQQGKALIKAGIEAGIKHVVFTATDRGQEPENDPTPIAHFRSKYNIEKDLIALAKATNLAARQRGKEEEVTYTLLRPAAFFENLKNDFLGKGFVSMWRLNSPHSALKLISTADVGKVAALAFLHSQDESFRNKAISLAAEEITVEEAARVFNEVTGKDIPETYGFAAKGLKWALREQLGVMFDWFKTDRFGVDVEEVKVRFPFVMGFREWLKEESA